MLSDTWVGLYHIHIGHEEWFVFFSCRPFQVYKARLIEMLFFSALPCLSIPMDRPCSL